MHDKNVQYIRLQLICIIVRRNTLEINLNYYTLGLTSKDIGFKIITLAPSLSTSPEWPGIYMINEKLGNGSKRFYLSILTLMVSNIVHQMSLICGLNTLQDIALSNTSFMLDFLMKRLPISADGYNHVNQGYENVVEAATAERAKPITIRCRPMVLKWGTIWVWDEDPTLASRQKSKQ
ncbi:hypothetical protein FF38_05780 [Lucilia cuprina]|uniref:Uncharacterized protein n=1 Tax=Lucilia cuprina TaxID=7375 RepID=A0A0L0CA77_LUCCU|nr:hypothetical protein FF38_05780 [Lucilia cuprina]